MVVDQEYLQILRGQYKQVWFSPFTEECILKTFFYNIGLRINISSYGDLYNFSLVEYRHLDLNDRQIPEKINYVVSKTGNFNSIDFRGSLYVKDFIYKDILT